MTGILRAGLDRGHALPCALHDVDLAHGERECPARLGRERDELRPVRHVDGEHTVGPTRLVESFVRLHVPTAVLVRDLGVERDREADGLAVLRDGDAVGRRRILLVVLLRDERIDLGQRLRIVDDHAHDALAVGELEVALDRLAVARRRREIVDAQDVGTALVREERDRAVGRRLRDPADRVALADPDLVDVGEARLALDPSVARDEDVRVFLDDVVRLLELDGRGLVADRSASGAGCRRAS
jgi:hypothetical protein